MDETSNIQNFDVNENCSTDNEKSNDANDILNGKAESQLSTAESVDFKRSSLSEKHILTSVNNNNQSEKLINSFTIEENPTCALRSNSEENIAFFSAAESNNGSSLLYDESGHFETCHDISTGCLNSSSKYENDFKSGSLEANLGSTVIPVGNSDFLPKQEDNLMSNSSEVPICTFNALPGVFIDPNNDTKERKELSMLKIENINSVTVVPEKLKDDKNNSNVIVEDLVDFSFREHDNVANYLLGNFTSIGSMHEIPETLVSNAHAAISNFNPAFEIPENKDLNTSKKSLDVIANVPENPAKISYETARVDVVDNKVALGDSSNLDYREKTIKEAANDISKELKKPSNVSQEALVIKEIANDISKEIEKSNNVSQEALVVNSDIPDSSTGNGSGKINKVKLSSQVPENFTSNKLESHLPIEVKLNISDKPQEQFTNPDIAIKVPEASSHNLVGQLAGPDTAFKVPETVHNNFIEQFVDPNMAFEVPEASSHSQVERLADPCTTFKVPETPNNSIEQFVDHDITLKVLEASSHNQVEHLTNPDTAFKVPETASSNSTEQMVDPDITFKELEVSSHNSMEQLENSNTAIKVPETAPSYSVDPDIAFKVPEVVPNNPAEQFGDPDIAFKVPEASSHNPVGQSVDLGTTFKELKIPSSNPVEQLADPDIVFKVPEVPSDCSLEQFLDSDFAMKIPENHPSIENDEAFVDAVQFFKDPNSFQFLENIRTSTVQAGSLVPRSSLYVNFDPLHSKFQTNMPRSDNCASISAAVQESIDLIENTVIRSPEVVNKHADIVVHESANTLISFDSPKQPSCMDSQTLVKASSPPNMFTEEELQQKLKIHELETQETYLKKQRDMEIKISKRDELLKCQQILIEEFSGILIKSSEEIKKYQEKIMTLETENEKQKDDLKTSAEDLQSVENTFADFYKRYEQCKGMLKTYKENEEHLKQTILDLQAKANEQVQTYHMFKERTEEVLEKANVEVDNVKRTGEAQVTVLKAQLKKAEMKISSLESDIKQIKIENSQLGGICDDLMAKVSRS